jgi:hypothetical protein
LLQLNISGLPSFIVTVRSFTGSLSAHVVCLDLREKLCTHELDVEESGNYGHSILKEKYVSVSDNVRETIQTSA